jgi:hypothetical protein
VNFINIAETKLRAGNARCCACCGRKLQPKRNSRRQRYCNSRCRNEARRARDFAGRWGSDGLPRSVENSPLISTACNDDFADRGYSISGPPEIIQTEIVAGRVWRSVTSPDGVVCKVAAIKFGAAP